jgi:hypothetical protein
MGGIRFLAEAGDFLFFVVSRLSRWPIQYHIQWVLGAPFLWVKRPEREADHSPHLVPMSRMVELYHHSPIGLHGMVLN